MKNETAGVARHSGLVVSWFLVLAVAVLSSGPVRAETAGRFERQSFRIVEVGRGQVLGIRERPDAGAAVVGDIPRNTRGVRGFGCTSETPSGRTWCRVKYRGMLGWARRFYLEPE